MNPTPEAVHASLFYQQGSSDKEYRMHLVPQDGGWVVNYEFGRRGSALRPGTKTATPLEYEAARALYDKVLKGQLREGYTPTEGGEAYQDTQREPRSTGVVPQLLNPVDDLQAEGWITDPGAVAQEKYDGERRPIHKKAGVVQGINLSGLTVALPVSLEAAAQSFGQKDWLIDTEDMGDHVWVFDLLEFNGEDLRPLPQAKRLEKLTALFADHPAFQEATSPFRLAPTARTLEEKRALVAHVRAKKGEGVVFKKSDAPYTPGRPNSGGTQVKLKFFEAATVRVVQGRGTRRSVAFEGQNTDGSWVPLGNVTIPPNKAIPAPGTLIEVRYLYAYPGGSLYQPTYLKPRTDVGPEACRLGQLKYKAEPGALTPMATGDLPKPKRAKP